MARLLLVFCDVQASSHDHLIERASQALLIQLARYIAHDLINSISFVLSNLRTLHEYHDELVEALPKPVIDSLLPVLDDLAPLVNESIEGVSRVHAIARELQRFARADDATQESVDIHEAIESAIKFTAPEVSLKAKIIRDYHAKARALGSATKLMQCISHLLLSNTRALIAGAEKRELILSTSNDENSLNLSLVSPSGFDMDVARFLWTPFFAPAGDDRLASPPTRDQFFEMSDPCLLLAAAGRIAADHGGNLTFDAACQPGPKLNLSLPSDQSQPENHSPA